MNEISIGAVGAAGIAGLVSLLGLIIAKEQKVSEFRQAWIDELRKCIVAYLVNINAICDALQLKKSGSKFDDLALLANYKSLNEASHGINLRVNSDEKPAQALLKSMAEFEDISRNNASLTSDNIIRIERKFIEESKNLLKFEWKRVKRGEKIFIWTKWIVSIMIAAIIALLIYLSTINSHTNNNKNNKDLENPLRQLTYINTLKIN